VISLRAGGEVNRICGRAASDQAQDVELAAVLDLRPAGSAG
jgi:hypothetical protein